jgi:DNA repair protein RecO (recombination protein O)
MLITTRGIVFRFTKFRETSIIANIYTEELGLNSYIVNSVRSAKSKFKIGYFEPLSLVDITCYHQANRDINRISEIKSAYPLHSLRQDIYKSAISMFIAEVLNKCIIERDKNIDLFGFLFNSILSLEKSEKNNSFHLQFMIKLAQYLGFGIHEPESLINHAINPQFFDNPKNMRMMQMLIEEEITKTPKISSEARNTLLSELIHYYRLQLDMPKLKSLEVLQTVFN